MTILSMLGEQWIWIVRIRKEKGALTSARSKENKSEVFVYEISLEFSQVEGNKTWSERPLDLFKSETASYRDDDEPDDALRAPEGESSSR